MVALRCPTGNWLDAVYPRRHIAGLERELAAMTAERDQCRDDITRLVEMAADEIILPERKLAAQLMNVTAERDALREELEETKEALGIERTERREYEKQRDAARRAGRECMEKLGERGYTAEELAPYRKAFDMEGGG